MTQNISPAQAYKWLKSGEAVLIDVREPDEFSAEHIGYASLLPLGIINDMGSVLDIPSGRKIIFQCMKGGRGMRACAAFPESPANPAFNLEGGIEAWKKEGLPVIGSGAGLSIFRQVQMIVGTLVLGLVVLGFMGLGLGFVLAGMIGGMLAFAGMTGWCGLAMLLSKMPWNKKTSCIVCASPKA
ncbi:MAG: DUF2892 domain-containing protein [Alphaproteobacteria bacterium]|nr:DUF2892 domain-containing protein [Alphaproteobacteria bacterium]